jgi:hypothetical protein
MLFIISKGKWIKLPPAISKCSCKNECKEKGKVCWESDGYQYFHIRVNGCMEGLNGLKRADCVIFRPTHNGKIYAFVIEVKTRYYDLDEVKEKIENTLNVLDNILNYSLIPIPIVYAESHRKWVKRYALQKKVRYKGKAFPITFLKYCESFQKAIRQ